MENKPVLSIGMIVKNEIRSIEKCLKALQPLRDAIPCELVIADTGSTDGTRELVMQYADIFFDFEWINDFSAARNAVMDRCSGEWYLTVDADEYLDPNISEFLLLLSGGFSTDVEICAVIQRNYMDTDDLTHYEDFYAARMVRMSTGARYKYPIHEVLALGDKEVTMFLLDHVILWHDGYLEQKGHTIASKKKRNLILLEQLLQERPDDLRVLTLAADSACTPEQERNYAKRIVELLESGKHNEVFKCGPAWQRVLNIAHNQDMSEFTKWHERAKQMAIKSLFVQVDGNYYAVADAWKRQDYTSVLEYGAGYLEGLKVVKNATPTEKIELLYSTLSTDKEKYRSNVELTMACAYVELKRWDECRKILKRYPAKDLKDQNLSAWLHATGTCAAGQKDEKLWKNFCDRLASIEEWNTIPPIVAKLILENDLPLPAQFFSQSTNRLIVLTNVLGGELKEKYPKILMDRTAQDGNDDDPKVVVWNHALLFAALTVADWESDDAETLQWLIETYVILASTVLNFYYNPEILCEEMVGLLPDMHHFGWFFLQAVSAKENRDNLAYIRWLRKALKAVPAMKAMVEYLLKDVTANLEENGNEKAAADAELMSVAAQIRTILAQYAPDDPAVVALKQTPAYQAVAHLITDSV